MFSSISVVPFHSKPYTASPIYFPHISDSPDVAREDEASTHSREVARPSCGVNRGARVGHTGGPVGPVETLVKVGRCSARPASRGSKTSSFQLRGQKSQGPESQDCQSPLRSDMLFLPARMSSRVLTAARRTDVISRHLASSKSMLPEIQEVAIISYLFPRIFLNTGVF